MKANEIQELFNSFESIAIEYEGVECWSARELYPLLGYANSRKISFSVKDCATVGARGYVIFCFRHDISGEI